jgi:diguanylate cyclase (GGDEF)-like protein
MRVVPAPHGGSFGASFDAGGGEVWVQAPDGLARVTPEGLAALPESWRFAGEHVEAVIPTGGGARLVVLKGLGLRLLVDGSARAVGADAARWLDAREVVAGALLPDGRVALATRRGGVAVLAPDFSLDETVGTAEGFPGDDALAIHVARDGALWVALDTGLSRVELSSPVSVFDRRTGLAGTVLSVGRHRGRLVVSSTAGLFAYEDGPPGAVRRPRGRFARVPGVGPGCFATASAGEDLLVATRAGVFVAGPSGARVVPGTETLAVYAVVPSLRFPGRFWLGLPDGVGLLRRAAEGWALERFEKGIGGPVRFVVELPAGDGEVWLGSVFRGVLRLRFPDSRGAPQVTSLGSADEVSLFPSRDGLRAVLAGRGVYRVDTSRLELVEDPVFSQVARDADLFLGEEDSAGNVWLNTVPPSFVLREDGRLGAERRVVAEVPGRDFQALVPLDDAVWLGSEDGLFRFEVSGLRPLQPLPAPLVRKVVAGRGVVLSGGAGDDTATALPVVPASAGRLRFECAPRTHGLPVTFQFLLEGAERDFSDPTPDASREYTNLREGSYAFRVRTRDPQGRTSPEARWDFRVLPPWHRAPAALALWVVLGAAGVVAALRLRHRALERRNGLLRSRVEERTRELAEAVAQLDAARAQLEERNVDLASANEKLTSLSYLDGLTGLANRRHFDETLQREWSRAARSGGELSVVMVDVDHFKKLNDLLGHPEGDRCLKEVAGVLSTGAARAGDLVARFGGEEFVLLLPQTAAEGAGHLAEELRARVEALRLPNPGSPLAVVTASFGVATAVPRDGGVPAELLGAADEALYDAKSSGRNRVAEG